MSYTRRPHRDRAVAIDPVTSFAVGKLFLRFPDEGNFVVVRGSSVHRALKPRSLSRDDALIRSSNASYSRITGNGVNPPRPMTQFTESRLY